MPAAYMFHDVPHTDLDPDVDPVAVALAEMDRFGVEIGLVTVTSARARLLASIWAASMPLNLVFTGTRVAPALDSPR